MLELHPTTMLRPMNWQLLKFQMQTTMPEDFTQRLHVYTYTCIHIWIYIYTYAYIYQHLFIQFSIFMLMLVSYLFPAFRMLHVDIHIDGDIEVGIDGDRNR